MAAERTGELAEARSCAEGALLAYMACGRKGPAGASTISRSHVVGQALLLEEDGSGELAQRAARIRTAAERCGRIVKSFLAMARQRDPERNSVDLNQIVRAALELVGYGK